MSFPVHGGAADLCTAAVLQKVGSSYTACSSCAPRMQRCLGDDVEKREEQWVWVGGGLRGYSRLIVVGTGTTLDLSKERNCLWRSQIGPGYSLLCFDVYDHNVV